MPKLFVAGASYEWIFSQPNTLNLDMSLTFGERYWMGGTTDCLNDSYLNQKIPFYQLIEVMVACSDNSATLDDDGCRWLGCSEPICRTLRN
ncbi:MAG UNVERIFIED_CONTAM: hypothetical protein LVT10_07130 [Anaerolineae bacterium]